jgi:hypothetical protein
MYDIRNLIFFLIFKLILAQNLSATIINMNPLLPERHISFAVNRENESNESHHTTIMMNDEDNNPDGNIAVTGKQNDR